MPLHVSQVKLSDRDELIKAAITSLASKVVSQNSELLAPIAVDAVLRVIDPAVTTNVDLHDIKVRACSRRGRGGEHR